MILIISDVHDAHADEVINILRTTGSDYFRLNLDTQSLYSTMITCDSIGWRVSAEKKTLIASNISVVWCRRTTVSLTIEEEEDTTNGFRLWKSEWNKTLFGLYASLSDAFWLNHIRWATLSDNKFYQLKVARKSGLSVPEFIVSNDKNLLIDFSKAYGDIALKFLSQDIYKSPDGSMLGLYVNKITARDLEKFGDLSENPVKIQKYISKKFEVRYTFIDGEHLVCRIDSQSSKIANVDWRRYDVANTPHHAFDPPNAIKTKIEHLMGELNLRFGAIDFIVDEDENWWFLEVNSAGQWLWVEDLTGLQIAQSIANCLMRHV